MGTAENFIHVNGTHETFCWLYWGMNKFVHCLKLTKKLKAIGKKEVVEILKHAKFFGPADAQNVASLSMVILPCSIALM